MNLNELQEIKDHPFFASIDFVKLLNKQIEPPFKPAVCNIDSTVYFDPEFTKRTPKGIIYLSIFIIKRINELHFMV